MTADGGRPARPGFRVPPRLTATVVVAVTAWSGAACGSAAARSGSAPHRLTGPSVAQIEQARQVTVRGKTVAVPTEIGAHPIAAAIDDGQQVIISATGFLPQRLFSTPDEAVTWTNLTDEDQVVIFDHLRCGRP